MKIVIAPDSFKGTMTARRVSELMEDAVRSVLPRAEVISIPVADGGEGTLEALGCEIRAKRVCGPLFEPVDAYYGVSDESALIEISACAGLALAGEDKNPMKTTTYGVGELIKAALDEGARDIVLTLGGSATNDLGCGMAKALGARFFGADGEFLPVGGSLNAIGRIDVSGMDERLKRTRVTALCDVTNPLYGEKGAAFVFAPQKGADPDMVKLLDEGLEHAADIIKRDLGVDAGAIEGGGAAGGLGAGINAFLGGELKRGAEEILNRLRFDEKIKDADYVLTGEGSFDRQSPAGKAVSAAASHAAAAGAKCIVIAGCVETCMEPCANVAAAFSIQQRPREFSEAIKHSEEMLYDTTRNVARLLS